MMKIRKIILSLLAGLLMASCSTDDREVGSASMMADNDSILSFEGVWSVNDVPVEQTYALSCSYHNGQQYVMFYSFPFEAVTAYILPDVKVAGGAEPLMTMTMRLAHVGNSDMSEYYNAVSAAQTATDKNSSEQSARLSYKVITQEEGPVVVTLGLLTDQSVFSLSNKAFGCILMVEHVEMDYADGRHRKLVLNPARKLTFVSTKRL